MVLSTVKDAAIRLIPALDSRPLVTAAGPFDIPIPDVVDLGTPIDTLDRIHRAAGGPGAALRIARTAGTDFRREFAASGRAARVSTHDLVTLPYPTRFGLWRAAVTPAPFLLITNRPGVAIVRTPGHATGNQTLVLNTDTGIWAMSENVVATELLTPEHSRIPGVAGWSRRWGQELILNANTIEATATQYTSCVLEKTLVDRSQADERFLQFFPTSELTASPFTPGTAPTFTHRTLQAGAR
ncbi:hypothetical protein A5733_09670 [Mycobacterium sp. NS-7484]|uniref:hypothetical protein n=1 Tax=Mycobacterium sp. NS-7484 TaxID=1834161 RepID=UPI00096CF138|nr:hypothetical protein [Mycobacterium sp. NS-7484]OMB97481.1 hypothetical protein A5733_09670 [Mycobacterium sp. NS-7484]